MLQQGCSVGVSSMISAIANSRRVQVQYMVPNVILGRFYAIETMTNNEDNQ